MAETSRRVLSPEEVRRCLRRVAHELVEQAGGAEAFALVGIRTRGVPLAQRLAALIKETEQVEVPVGILDITLYRDDLTTIGTQPVLGKTEIPFRIDRKNVVLVDDVLFTGRTVRAALDCLVVDLGRPRCIQLMVLIDRGHRELPIHADFVGKRVETTRGEQVTVRLTEVDGVDEVIIEPLPHAV